MRSTSSPKAKAKQQSTAPNTGSEATNKKKKKRKTKTPKIDPFAAKEAHALVDEHLQPLKPLLESLRQKKGRSYQKAVSSLARSARHIAKIKERDPQLFQLELEVLKSKTQADLLIAKLKLHDSAADRAELQVVSKQLLDARIKHLRYQQKMLEKRLETIKKQLTSTEEQLEEVEPSTSASAEALYQQFLRRADRKDSKE